ncbi:MAG TPA: DUF1559 domain-containing protein, partial [Gemmataceae bacterium]|nr:DUF1559 domain-containing protein [Gemmataceae bacterium]
AWAYNTAPYDFQVGITPVNGTGIAPWALNIVKPYTCPSDDLNFIPVVDPATGLGGYLDGMWNVSPNSIFVDFLPPPTAGTWIWNPIGGTNYMASSGGLGDDTGWVRYKGIYYKNSKTKVASIRDGTSNTIAFGETIAGEPNGTFVNSQGQQIPAPRNWIPLWPAGGDMPSAWGIQPHQGNGWDILQYSSKHSGGVINFAFADGSVHSVNPSIDYATFIYLSGMQDGHVIDISQFTN